MMRIFQRPMGIVSATTSQERGLSLVEFLVALTVLLLALPGIYMLFSFTVSAFSSGESRMDLQQNLRVVAEYVVEETRYADELILIQQPDAESEVNARRSEGYDYLWTDEAGALMHNEDPQFASISQRIDLALQFSVNSEEDPTLLRVTIVGHRDDGSTVSYESEVRLLNTSIYGTVHGVAVEYQKPAPPFMVLQSLNFLHGDPNTVDGWSESDFVRGHLYAEGITDVFAVLKTRNAPHGPTSHIEIVSGPVAYTYSDNNVNVEGLDQEIIDDESIMRFHFWGGQDGNQREPSGSYEVRCKVQDTEWSTTISALYRIYPALHSMKLSGIEDSESLLEDEHEKRYTEDDPFAIASGDADYLNLKIFDVRETIEVRKGDSGGYLTLEPDQAEGTEYSIPIADLLGWDPIVIRLNSSDGTVYTDYYLIITAPE